LGTKRFPEPEKPSFECQYRLDGIDGFPAVSRFLQALEGDARVSGKDVHSNARSSNAHVIGHDLLETSLRGVSMPMKGSHLSKISLPQALGVVWPARKYPARALRVSILKIDWGSVANRL
jgi:hypothetical protein